MTSAVSYGQSINRPLSSGARHTTPWDTLPFATIWLLSLVTISTPDGSEGPATQVLTAIKLVARAIVFVLLMSFVIVAWQKRSRRIIVTLMLPLGLFVAWSLSSIAWSALKSHSMMQSGQLLLLWLFACVVALEWSDRRDTSRLLAHLCFCLFTISSVLVVTYFFVSDLATFSREAGGAFHATEASAAGSLGIVILVSARCLWGWKWTRLLFLPGIAVHVCVLFLAHNRMSVVLTAVLVSGLALVFANRSSLASFIIAGVALIATYMLIDPGLRATDDMVAVISNYMARGQTTMQLSELSGRLEMWNAVWQSFLQSPIIGHGYLVSSADGRLYAWYVAGNWTAHNILLQALVSTGVVGATLFLWGVIRPSVAVLRGAFAKTVAWQMGILFGTTIVWFFGWGLINEAFIGPLRPQSVVFFAIMGLAVGNVAHRPISTKHRSYMAAAS